MENQFPGNFPQCRYHCFHQHRVQGRGRSWEETRVDSLTLERGVNRGRGSAREWEVTEGTTTAVSGDGVPPGPPQALAHEHRIEASPSHPGDRHED